MIGTGWIAHEMADALNAVNGEIYAAADVNEEMLEKFAKEKHIKHTFTNPDEMIADPNIDIIYIATPHTFHYEYIKKNAVDKNQREYILREQMQLIREELGESNTTDTDVEKFRAKADKLKAGKEIKDKLLQAFQKN